VIILKIILKIIRF